jgi:hypothetical protein
MSISSLARTTSSVAQEDLSDPFFLFPAELVSLICEYLLNERWLEQIPPNASLPLCVRFLTWHRETPMMAPFKSALSESQVESSAPEELVVKTVQVITEVRRTAAFLGLEDDADSVALAEEIVKEQKRLLICFPTFAKAILNPPAGATSILDLTGFCSSIRLRSYTNLSVISNTLTALPRAVSKMGKLEKVNLTCPNLVGIPESVSHIKRKASSLKDNKPQKRLAPSPAPAPAASTLQPSAAGPFPAG